MCAASKISNNINVIYVKNLSWFIHIAQKFVDFSDKEFFASGVNEFYFVKLSENIEVRNWNKFWSDVDNGEDFLKRLNVCRNVFKGEYKNELGLKNHFKYTLARDMWEDLKYEHCLRANWAVSFCEELVPKTEEELEVLEGLYKGGFYYCNEKYYGKKVYNVHCYDISSAYLSYLSRKKFPCGGFVEAKTAEEINQVLSKKYDCWYSRIGFHKLKYKINFPIDLQKFGVREKLNDKPYWVLTLTNVDMEWFKQVFEWEDTIVLDFFYAPQKELCKNYARMFKKLYEDKNSQKKGTFAKEIFKFRAELPYGQPMKATSYGSKVVWTEKNGFVVTENKEKTFAQIQKSIIQRGIPMQVSYWVAAYARLEFFTVLSRIGLENVVYGDTDSVKFIGFEGLNVIKERNREIKEEFEKINKKRILDFNEKLGQWCDEGDVAVFKAIGIKWYITIDMEKKIDVKAAGAEKETLLEWALNQKDPVGKFNLAMSVPNLFKEIKPSTEKRYGVCSGYKKKIDNGMKKELLQNGTALYYYKEEEITND